jgi:tetratricopeptide (TPR) repeat protein
MRGGFQRALSKYRRRGYEQRFLMMLRRSGTVTTAVRKSTGTTVGLPVERNLAETALADSSAVGRRCWLVLTTIALVYAFLANFRKVSDADLFWQLATGRWIVQHHHIFSTDVFSYTAPGQPWIYPVVSGLLFYAAYLIGGYSLITWIGAVTCAGTVALLLRRSSVVSAGIAILAVPVVAMRSAPRAEMFTVVLFAAYLSILWQNYQTSRAPLWLLPLLMIAWVNLHLGFIAGLAAIAAFAGIEASEMLFAGARRQQAIQKLRRASPWFAATALASLVNPWGWGIYEAVLRQDRAMKVHSGWIVEWGRMRLNWPAAATALSLRNTKDTFYLLLMIAVIAGLVALLQRQLGAAILLGVAIYAGVQHVRMQALAACVVVVVAGSILSSELPRVRAQIPNPRVRAILAAAMVAMLGAFVLIRSFDLVTNHQRNYSLLEFGAGLSWWLPEGAVQFVERENPPAEIFNTYDEGGYLIWRLGDKYRDHFDGRAIPFGPDSFQHDSDLSQTSPDSELWQQEESRYNINTIILPLARFEGVLNTLRIFCQSSSWRPVYLDEVSIVFVRQKPETEDLIRRSPVNCETAPLPRSPSQASFDLWANAASVLAALGRNPEALAAAEKARQFFPDSPFVPWLRGNIFEVMGLRSDAEQEYRAAVALEPSEAVFWFALATAYKHEGQIPQTIDAQRRGIDLSSTPQPRELIKLARLYLDTQQPKQALQTFDEAVRSAPPDVRAESGARSFNYDIALGRAAAWRQLGDNKRAASFDDEAVRDLYPQP